MIQMQIANFLFDKNHAWWADDLPTGIHWVPAFIKWGLWRVLGALIQRIAACVQRGSMGQGTSSRQHVIGIRDKLLAERCNKKIQVRHEARQRVTGLTTIFATAPAPPPVQPKKWHLQQHASRTSMQHTVTSDFQVAHSDERYKAMQKNSAI